MPIYLPQNLVAHLSETIAENTSASIANGDAIAGAIADLIYAGINDTYDASVDIIGNVHEDILDDVDNALNNVSTWIRSELDLIIDTFGPALQTALTQLAESNLIGQEVVKESIEQGQQNVIQTNEVVTEVIVDEIQETGNWVTNTIDFAKEAIVDTSVDLFNSVGTLVDWIKDLPSKLISEAIEFLIPAQIQGTLHTITQFFQLGPFDWAVKYVGEHIKAKLSELLTVDEEEIIKWTGHIYRGMIDQTEEITRGMEV